MKRKSASNHIIFGLILFLLVSVVLFSGVKILESTVLRQNSSVEDSVSTKTIIRDGVAYFPRQDITVVMVLGIDRYDDMESSGFYRNSGDADMVSLLVFDEVRQVCDVLCLNRDSMVEIPVLGLGGKQAGTTYAQLALAYTYGTGLEDSCENVKSTLETLLHGLHIDNYVAMNMEAIVIMNDAVGGVTVDVTDDFSDVDPSITMGTVTLLGEQALHYVQTRKDVGDQLNVSRMERQKAYMTGFMESLQEVSQNDLDALLDAYDDASPYMVTDCSVTVLSNMVQKYGEYELGRILTPEGENHLGEEYYEFYLDEDALDALTLALFYAEK